MNWQQKDQEEQEQLLISHLSYLWREKVPVELLDDLAIGMGLKTLWDQTKEAFGLTTRRAG